MDFAKKQMEKYGWSEGKGLGKTENGIQQAIKPKHKRGKGGVGHKIADEFTNHWWQRIYNKATENIEVKTSNHGEVQSISAKNKDKFDINTTKFVKAKSNKDSNIKSQYMGNFVKRALLSNGETQQMEPAIDASSDSEDEIIIPNQKLTDDELFAACGGRTAHKGARHGLKLNGKLARITKHEELLLEKIKTNHKKNTISFSEKCIKINDKTKHTNHVIEEPIKLEKKKKSKLPIILDDELGRKIEEKTTKIVKNKRKMITGICDSNVKKTQK